MSRVTIDNIQHDASGLDNMSWAEITKLYQIEVVPRKMVEMIIEKCEETIKKQERVLEYYVPDSYISGNAQAVKISTMQLKEYAESLLRQFEKD